MDRSPIEAGPPDAAARDRADEALRLVLIDPAAALRAAEAVLTRTKDPWAACVAHRAAGLALAETADLSDASRRLITARDLARRHGLRNLENSSRISLAVVLAGQGRLAGALAELDAAGAAPGPGQAAQVQAQRGLVLARAGRYADAMDCFRAALPGLRRAGDRRFEALVLLNRGALHAEQSDLPGARADLNRCVAVARTAGLPQLVADAENNLGFAAARAGDFPAAFAAFDRAESVTGIGPAQLAATGLDRARALLSARLAADAAEEIRRALPLLDRLGHDLDAADARLLLAQAALATDRAPDACAAAQDAARALRAQRRPGWAMFAEQLHLRARFAADVDDPGLPAAIRRNVVALDRLGWAPAALEARVLLARVLLERGDRAAAAQVLGATTTPHPGGSAERRVAGWHAVALLRLANDDPAGVLSATRAGLRVVREHADALGALELRTHAAGNGTDLAALGLRVTLAAGSPAAVFAWSEELRANALALPATRPPRDPALAHDLQELRRVNAALTEAIATGADPRPAAAARVALEHAVRARRRATANPKAGGPTRRPDRSRLVRALGPRALVSYLVSGPDLHAVTLVDGRYRRHDLGRHEVVGRAVDQVRFLAARLARAGREGASPSPTAARVALGHVSTLLGGILCEPLPELADRPVVIVPTGELYALPWSLLPGFATRPVVLAPSARLWLRAQAEPPTRRDPRVLLVAGPALRHARSEIRTVARAHPCAVALTARAATADAVLAGLEGASLAHLACHGRFRADNPQFSVLELADGPLNVHDLAQLRRPPEVLVLSACESGRCAVGPGDEILGLAAALLSGGTRTLIASVLEVPDADTGKLMVELHRRLADGAAPAEALATAINASGVHGFVCLGTG